MAMQDVLGDVRPELAKDVGQGIAFHLTASKGTAGALAVKVAY